MVSSILFNTDDSIYIINWNHIIVYKLLILDKNTWNPTILYKLFVWDKNTLYRITVCNKKSLKKQLEKIANINVQCTRFLNL